MVKPYSCPNITLEGSDLLVPIEAGWPESLTTWQGFCMISHSFRMTSYGFRMLSTVF